MLSEIKSKSLIERARSAKDGVLLQQVINLERARLREHGSKDGLDKFKATSIKLFKNSSDFAGFKKDCLAAFQHFRSGLECVNLLAHFNKKEYGIDPDNEILLRMFDSFDKNMATRTQIALGRRIDLLLNKFESGEDRPDFGQDDQPDRKQGPGAIQRMAPVHIINEDLDWDTENEHVVLDFGPDDDTEHEHFDEALILSKVTDGGKVDYQQNWVNLRQVRAVPAREKVRFAKITKSASVELASDSEGEDDAFEDGYTLEFPSYVLYWGYRHISKDARNVDSSLYHDMVSRIQHEAARDAVISGAKSSALFALHLLEEMFGRNAATQTIDKHLEHSSILYRADLGPADFAMRMRRARAYRATIHPNVQLLLDALCGLQKGGLTVRGDQERQSNQTFFNKLMKALPDVVQCPEKSTKMFDEIDREMREIDGAVQSSRALSGATSISPKNNGSANTAAAQKRGRGGQCPLAKS